MSSAPQQENAGPLVVPTMRWASHVSVARPLSTAFGDCIEAVTGRVGQQLDLAFLFVCGHAAAAVRELAAEVSQRLPHTVLLGCTAGGVIGGGRELEGEMAVSLTAGSLPGAKIHPFHLDSSDMPDLDGAAAAWETWVGVPASERPSFVLLPEPFTFDIDACLQGLDYAYGDSPKIGGLASGASRPGENVLLLQGPPGRRRGENDEPSYRDGLVGVALSGAVRLDPLVAQGCRPVGHPMVVTECDQNRLLALDHQTPMAVLQELVPQLDIRDRRLLSGSLFIGLASDSCKADLGPGDFLVRNIIGIEKTRGAMSVGAMLRPGQRMQFHLRDAESSRHDLETLCLAYQRQHSDTVASALMFSCLGRGRHLYGTPDHDIRLFERRVAAVPVGGFFCSGEIGPVGTATYVHGYTSSFGIFRNR